MKRLCTKLGYIKKSFRHKLEEKTNVIVLAMVETHVMNANLMYSNCEACSIISWRDTIIHTSTRGINNCGSPTIKEKDI